MVNIPLDDMMHVIFGELYDHLRERVEDYKRRIRAGETRTAYMEQQQTYLDILTLKQSCKSAHETLTTHFSKLHNQAIKMSNDSFSLTKLVESFYTNVVLPEIHGQHVGPRSITLISCTKSAEYRPSIEINTTNSVTPKQRKDHMTFIRLCLTTMSSAQLHLMIPTNNTSSQVRKETQIRIEAAIHVHCPALWSCFVFERRSVPEDCRQHSFSISSAAIPSAINIASVLSRHLIPMVYSLRMSMRGLQLEWLAQHLTLDMCGKTWGFNVQSFVYPKEDDKPVKPEDMIVHLCNDLTSHLVSCATTNKKNEIKRCLNTSVTVSFGTFADICRKHRGLIVQKCKESLRRKLTHGHPRKICIDDDSVSDVMLLAMVENVFPNITRINPAAGYVQIENDQMETKTQWFERILLAEDLPDDVLADDTQYTEFIAYLRHALSFLVTRQCRINESVITDIGNLLKAELAELSNTCAEKPPWLTQILSTAPTLQCNSKDDKKCVEVIHVFDRVDFSLIM